MARALPQALSVDTAEESSVSLVSDSVSVDSTVTLENLPFKPSRLLTPPWSTETSREGVAEDEGGGAGGGGLEPDRSESPGWSETQSVGLALDWARVPYWDSTRSAPGLATSNTLHCHCHCQILCSRGLLITLLVH